jgi:hypothetical protein
MIESKRNYCVTTWHEERPNYAEKAFKSSSFHLELIILDPLGVSLEAQLA